MRWSYKTVHYELKKEGILGSAFLDEPEIELSLNQYGKAGWELVSLIETMDGLIAVFKQPLNLETRTFSSPSKASDTLSQPPRVQQEKASLEKPVVRMTAGPTLRSDEVAEVQLLDEFEVVEDKVESNPVRSVEPVDIGLIRIE